jgi:hypothetical protein
MTSRGGICTGGCGGRCSGGCGGRKGKRGRRSLSTSVPSSSSAFSKRSSRESIDSYSHLKFKSRRKLRIYYLKAQLLPQNCVCIGNTAQCPFFLTPVVSTIPNVNIPSGMGQARFTIVYDPITKLGQTSWRISSSKLYSMGNQVWNPIRAIEVRISSRCGQIGPIVLNPLAISLLATAGETPDGNVVGSATLEKARVQQLLHNLGVVCVRGLLFESQLPFGDINGRLMLKREERVSR